MLILHNNLSNNFFAAKKLSNTTMASKNAKSSSVPQPQATINLNQALYDMIGLLPHSCHICGKPAQNFCSRCRSVKYCSSECQMTDWKSHKLKCTAHPYTLVATELPKAISAFGRLNVFNLRSKARTQAATISSTLSSMAANTVTMANLQNLQADNAKLIQLDSSMQLQQAWVEYENIISDLIAVLAVKVAHYNFFTRAK